MTLSDLMAVFKAITTNPFAVIIFMALTLKMMLNDINRKIAVIHDQVMDIKAAVLKIDTMLISHAERISKLEGRWETHTKGGNNANIL